MSFFALSAAPAATRYVSRNGSDAGAGSSSSPFRTVTRAQAVSVEGDGILVGPGTYEETLRLTKRLRLASWNGPFTIRPRTNQPPVVNAGNDQSINGLATLLSGTASDDGLPNPPGRMNRQWAKVSGPGSAAFDSPNNEQTRVVVSAYGTYEFRLLASDGASTVSDSARVTFQPGPTINTKPVVEILTRPSTVVLPASIALTARVTDDGLPDPPRRVTLAWSKVSGPGTVTFSAPNASSTIASFSTDGTYELRLVASDSALSGSDSVEVVVTREPCVNCPPVPYAGLDKVVLSGTSVALVGTVTDDGRPNPPGRVTTTWLKISGPGSVTFGNASALTTTASFSMAGTYVVGLRADDGQLQRTDSAIIKVEPNTAPVVNAGTDRSIDLPDAAFLNGTATDDGHPNAPGRLTITWSKVSGPGGVSFGNAAQPNTTASFSAPGVYVLRLTATDGDKTSSDTVQVTAHEAREYLRTYENTQVRCGTFGNQLRIKNDHSRRSISYAVVVRYRTLLRGEYEETKRGVLAPGESQPFACSDWAGGPAGVAYVSHRISAANFASPAGMLALAGYGETVGPELTYAVSATEVRLSWPSYLANGVLEVSERLGTDAQWEPVSALVLQDEDRQVVVLPSAGAGRFFRLRLP